MKPEEPIMRPDAACAFIDFFFGLSIRSTRRERAFQKYLMKSA
jgi:hypothetical protein